MRVFKTEKRLEELQMEVLNTFEIPKPAWKEERFRTTKKFLEVFNAHKCSDKGYIKSRDLENFINALFDDVGRKDVNIQELKIYIEAFLYYFEKKRQRWISMAQIFDAIEEILVPNILLDFRGRVKYSSVDIMQIWTHYNSDHSMTMDELELEHFVFDLLSTDKQKCNPVIIKNLTNKMLQLSEEQNEISLRGLSRILPKEECVLNQYENLQALTEKDIQNALAFYDQNDEGTIDGCELYALIKDILEANGYEDPFNMNVIHAAIKFLQQEGAVTENGALDKTCTKTLFTLGLNETSL